MLIFGVVECSNVIKITVTQKLRGALRLTISIFTWSERADQWAHPLSLRLIVAIGDLLADLWVSKNHLHQQGGTPWTILDYNINRKYLLTLSKQSRKTTQRPVTLRTNHFSSVAGRWTTTIVPFNKGSVVVWRVRRRRKTFNDVVWRDYRVSDTSVRDEADCHQLESLLLLNDWRK
jgi:hypothetical protein